MNKEKFLVYVSVFIIGFGLLMPVAVRSWYMRYNDYKGLAGLGSVGDFLAGTTVTFLNTGSILLLLATVLMQRKEVKISQKGIDELIQQTKFAKEQAEEARKETKLTNYTMKKQQFDSTFFNMINLHHNILKEIKYKNSTGREVIQILTEELKKKYDTKVYQGYSEKIKKEIFLGDKNILDNFTKKIYINDEYTTYTEEFEKSFHPDWNAEENSYTDFSRSDKFYEDIENGNDNGWNYILDQALINYENEKEYNSNLQHALLKQVDFNYLSKGYSNKELSDDNIIQEFSNNFYDSPLKSLKREAYELMYKDHENIIGHYYRNLYRIVKLIQDHQFDSDTAANHLEQQIYRGILRAQLSANELQMIFYNIVYSKKGEKFMELLRNTNFFDDHLILDELIWNNDHEELRSLSVIN